ncbi:tenascin [Chelmon rostratus]|uniref:tenascin n=1 Tax=Chelmon rostratus TaxID=109905 RepID=UPI001BE75589|nr:tenascin [Chelmon rostratus]
MFAFIPCPLLVLLLAAPALLTPSTSQELQVRGQRTPRDAKQDSIKVVISEGCATQGDSSDVRLGGKEIDLTPGSPLILTHKIKLVPADSGAGSGSCGCETEFAALRERLERLEREVSALREKCGGAEGGCCTSKESKGAGCSIKPETDECPNECSDQGRCVDGKCVCFPGFRGPDCSESDCPGNCNDNGRCVNGQCACDPGFTGPDCSQRGCPDNCNNRGRCVNGRCVCDGGFTGPSCSDEMCPGNCNNKGRCVNGQCVCNPGFTGPDCSKRNSCPGNCNKRGRCINGQCVCNPGFAGPDCSKRACPDNCNNRGRCVNGKCVCDSGFTGADCSENSCPENCNNRGRCVNGQCVCNDGFTGADCSEKACPNNCSNRGKCVNGKCVCDVGFAGPDCASKGCPNNCNNKGRCVKGRCVCRRGFTGPDCSQCEEGMTGPNCDTVMSGVSQLTTRDITETSVTLVWTPPPVQYETYHITFTSQKESDQQITVQVEGSLTTFTQTGLAAGQEYTVSISGETGGRRGAESSAEFMTLMSGPTNLQVVKTTSTSAVVQWEQSQGEIDRYRLTITPSDTPGRSQEMTVPVGQNSAHIQQLEAGRLYDIILVAEKGSSRSEPATTQVTPGNTLPMVTTAALTMQVTLAPGQDVGNRDQDFDPSPGVRVFDQHERKDGSEADAVKVGGMDGPNKDSTASVIARTKPLVNRNTAKDGTKPKLAERPTLTRKPNVTGLFRFNTSRVVPGARKFGPGPLKKPPVGEKKKKKVPVVPKKLKPGVPTIGDRTVALTMRDPTTEASGNEGRDAKNPLVMPGTDLDTNRQSGSEEEIIAVGSKELPDVGMAGHGNDTAPVSPEPTGTVQSQEKKCSVESNEPDESSKGTTDVASSEDRKLPPSGKAAVPFFRRTPAKSGFVRRPRPNFGSFQNKTRLHLRAPHRSPPHLNLIPGKETESRNTSTSELLSSPSSSASEESSSVEVNIPVRDTSGFKDGATTPASSEVEHNEKKMPTERGRIPVRRLPLKRGYLHGPLPNSGPLKNRIRPNLRLLPPPSQPLSPASETRKEQLSSTELLATSSPVSKESYPAKGTGPIGEENEDGVGTSMSTEFSQTLRGSGVNSSHQPSAKVGYFRRPQLYGGRLPNKTRTNLRPPQHPYRGPVRKPFPTRKLNGGSGIIVGSQTNQLEKVSASEIPDNQAGEQNALMPTQGVQIRQSGEQDTVHTEVIPRAQTDAHDTTIRPQTKELEEMANAPVQTAKSGEEDTRTPEFNSDSDIHTENVHAAKNTQDRPTIKQTSNSRHGAPRPVTLPKRQPPTRSDQMRHYISGTQRRVDTKTNNTTKRLLDSKTEQTRSDDSKRLTGSDFSSPEVTREPLDYVGVTNRTSDGFTLTWDSPEGKYRNFVVTRKQVGKDGRPKQEQSKKDHAEDQEDSEKQGHNKAEEANLHPTKETEPEKGSSEDENRVPESISTGVSRIQSSTAAKLVTGSDSTFKKVLPAPARSFQFEDLPPQTEYTVTLLGKGPGLLSRLHKLVISTGPEPPTDIVFSKVTENSLTVSWTKPKTSISGFKVTYTHVEDGEPVSVSVDSEDSTLGLSRLSPGSSYEVSVISILGLDESDPIKDFVMTLPDPPTDLRAVNVTDTKALLLWRPALAAIDKYAIVYGSGTGSEVRVTVSGNAAEQQLSGLEGSTTYTVTITSQLGSLESSAATTTFTTAGGSGRVGEGPRDLQASNVTPRTALLSWKPPSNPVGSYRLTYQAEGHEMKEVIVDASATEHNLTRLHPGSTYTVQLQAEEGGRYTGAVAAEFTTGTLRFPFPTDCSQELLNGIRTSGEVEVFPQGKPGTPIMVYCDMETDGGGWTVFQRRRDGSVDFFRGWKEYVTGFGDLSGEFWLGLDSLHNLTAMNRMSLRIDLRDKDESVFAKYSTFEVAKRNYRLTVGGYSGTAGDSLSYHNNRVFSTKDRDPAPFITRCAMSYRGGWWYKNCHEANLNGLYGIDVKHQGVIWTTWKGKEFSIPFTEMKMRPAAFSPPTRG